MGPSFIRVVDGREAQCEEAQADRESKSAWLRRLVGREQQWEPLPRILSRLRQAPRVAGQPCRRAPLAVLAHAATSRVPSTKPSLRRNHDSAPFQRTPAPSECPRGRARCDLVTWLRGLRGLRDVRDPCGRSEPRARR
jgi:hypothetical protein